MITRRSLFGLGVGAAATAVVPHNAAAAEREFVFKREVMVGLDFGKNPAALIRVLGQQQPIPDGFLLDLREIECDIRFPDALPDKAPSE